MPTEVQVMNRIHAKGITWTKVQSKSEIVHQVARTIILSVHNQPPDSVIKSNSA